MHTVRFLKRRPFGNPSFEWSFSFDLWGADLFKREFLQLSSINWGDLSLNAIYRKDYCIFANIESWTFLQQ